MLPAQLLEADRPPDQVIADVRCVRVRTTGGVEVCARCALADTPLRRMRGLLGRAGLAEDEGILIRPTNAIHMWFMRFAIDAVFLDGENRILRIAADLRPWRMAARRGAKAVLELPAGTCARVGLGEGEQLVFEAPQ